jgi:transposase
MRPSYDDLLLIIEEQKRLIEEQRKTIERLEKRVAELEERLNLNSNNSSKPPSSDQKKNKQPPRGGAVKGHPGYSRKQYSDDEISKRVISPLTQCQHCGCKKLEKTPSYYFQQVDLPQARPLVTQIELEKGVCTHCHRHSIASFPEGYDRSSFGPRLISLIGVCSSVYRMSKRVIQTLLQTLFDIEISLGSIPAMERKVSKGLSHSYKELLSAVNNSKVAYVDETSFREAAQTSYVWTATTKVASLIRILPTRGLSSLDSIRPRNHPGITVTDRYQVYAYDKHQHCLAHVKRDFKKFSERDGPDGDLGQRALFELQEVFAATHRPFSDMRQRVAYRKQRLKNILYDGLANGSETFARFADRLLLQFHKLFLFTRYPEEVECTNNAAERTLRHIVLWRKTSYGTQSEEGSRFMERAVSIWMTLKKQGRRVLPYFEQAYRATYNPAISPPVICPH